MARKNPRVERLLNTSPIERIVEGVAGMARKRKNPALTAEDQEAADFARQSAARFPKGHFTASQTGAKQLASKRGFRRDMGELAKSLTAGTAEAEEYIRSKKYKKGGR